MPTDLQNAKTTTCYIIGCNNVGKSTIKRMLNKLVRLTAKTLVHYCWKFDCLKLEFVTSEHAPDAYDQDCIYFLVYDVSQLATLNPFLGLNRHLFRVSQNNNSNCNSRRPNVFLVGNKRDFEYWRQVPADGLTSMGLLSDGDFVDIRYGSTVSVKCVEISAYSGENFSNLAAVILRNIFINIAPVHQKGSCKGSGESFYDPSIRSQLLRVLHESCSMSESMWVLKIANKNSSCVRLASNNLTRWLSNYANFEEVNFEELCKTGIEHARMALHLLQDEIIDELSECYHHRALFVQSVEYLVSNTKAYHDTLIRVRQKVSQVTTSNISSVWDVNPSVQSADLSSYIGNKRDIDDSIGVQYSMISAGDAPVQSEVHRRDSQVKFTQVDLNEIDKWTACLATVLEDTEKLIEHLTEWYQQLSADIRGQQREDTAASHRPPTVSILAVVKLREGLTGIDRVQNSFCEDRIVKVDALLQLFDTPGISLVPGVIQYFCIGSHTCYVLTGCVPLSLNATHLLTYLLACLLIACLFIFTKGSGPIWEIQA